MEKEELKIPHEIGRKAIGGFPGHPHIHPTGEQLCLNCSMSLKDIIEEKSLYCDKNILKKTTEEMLNNENK